jgi:hypothetical protein
MKPLDILTRHKIDLPFKLGEEIGCGCDGQVFEVIEGYGEYGYPIKRGSVIKLSAIYGTNSYRQYLRVAAHLGFLQHNRTPHFAAVFNFGLLVHFDLPETISSTSNRMQPKESCTVYFYEMEKLLPLSSEETKLFHTLLSHEDANKQKDFSPEGLTKRVDELADWFIFEKKDVLAFCLAATSGKIRHKDLHERNIMRNRLNQFKLVDLDRLELTQ